MRVRGKWLGSKFWTYDFSDFDFMTSTMPRCQCTRPTKKSGISEHHKKKWMIKTTMT